MIRNLRDLGGLTAADGRKVKNGYFFRSAMLRDLTECDIKWIRDNNIDLILDLRSQTESCRYADTDVPGAKIINFYLQDERGTGPNYKGLVDSIMAAESESERISSVPSMSEVYRTMIRLDFNRNRFAKLIHTIVGHEGGAVLFHCTSGKDRTGMTAATIFSMLGVDRETIFDDYMLSAAHAEWESEKKHRQFLCMGASEELAFRLTQLFVLDRSYLEAFFDEIEKRCGSIERFIRDDIGFSSKEIYAFRERMLE